MAAPALREAESLVAAAAGPAPEQPYRRVEHAEPQHGNVVLVDWMLGNACSFACSYCPPGLHDGSIRWQGAEAVLALYDAIRAHYVDGMGREVWIQFTGGEPTMHPRIVTLLQEAARRGFSTSLISNASRTLRFWRMIRPELRSVILTYHDEFVDHGHFLEIAGLLTEAMPVHVNVTMHPDRFDATFRSAEDLAARLPQATFALKPLRVDFGSGLYPYTPEQLKRLETVLTRPAGRGATPRGIMVARRWDGRAEPMRANGFIIHGTNRWRGYRCQAGLESLRVKGDGRVYRAVCAVGGEIGRLGGRIELPRDPIRCDRERCSCVADILITKEADG